MEFIPRESEEILTELQSWTTSPESQVEGTFEYDVYSSNALEFMKVENELAEAYRANFAQTTWADYLDMRAAEHGVYRRAANKAIGTLTVTGNGIIPAGSIFATEKGTRFISTSEVVVQDSATIEIEAQKAGVEGNVAANTITKIPLSIPGIESCMNDSETYDGYDAEDDETLRQRLLDKVRLPATSGNPAEYCAWAMSIVGVGAARCIRCPNGAGTVKVSVIDSNFEEVNTELLNRVQTYIDSQRPVGIMNGDVQVVSASPVSINISADVSGDIDAAAFREELQTYFTQLLKKNYSSYQTSTKGILVSAAKIGALIITAGGADTYDVDTLLINGNNDDIQLEVDQFPKIGDINLS